MIWSHPSHMTLPKTETEETPVSRGFYVVHGLFELCGTYGCRGEHLAHLHTASCLFFLLSVPLHITQAAEEALAFLSVFLARPPPHLYLYLYLYSGV